MSSPAITVSQGVAASPSRPSSIGYLQGPIPARLILGAFFALTLPLAALLTTIGPSLLTAAYICLFGTTHFVITFAVYLRSDNLRHFTSTLQNQIRYFGIPILLFAAFYLIGVTRLVATVPLFGLIFGAIVRMADFNHLNRQTFGVHQLFKARAGVRAPAQLKKLENLYFGTLSCLLYCTYLAGGHTPLLAGSGPVKPIAPLEWVRPAAYVFFVLSLGLLATIITKLIRAWRESGRPSGIGEALAYLTFQTIGTAFAIISLPLYAAALAIHYVEYHVLMYPRCFHSTLDDTSALDRWFGRLRSRPMRFYGLIIGVSAIVYCLMAFSVSLMGINAQPNASQYLAFVAIFDGLFVFHYFVETLIWRFNDPYFRKDLGLYFAPRS